MAFDLSKLNFFSKLDAKARVLVLIGSLVGMVFLVYLGTRFFSGSAATVGPSRVAAPPRGLQTVPGGQQSPEFSKAVEQANVQRAQQAALSGESAIPTLVNLSQPQAGAPCVICAEQVPNVQNTLNEWVKQGKISPDTAKGLAQLASRKVPVVEFAAALDNLVKDGKLTPAQARELLDTYTAQYAGMKVNESAQVMDDMIKAGLLPLASANELLEMQKAKVSTTAYGAKLQDMVDEGKISPSSAQRLLAQYTQQQIQEGIARRVAALREMAAKGEITPDVENELIGLERQLVSVDSYASTLDRLTGQGKITPAVSKKILDGYKAQKNAIGPTNAVDALIKAAEAAAYGELSDLLKEGKITQDVANLLGTMIQQNVPLSAFIAAVDQLVQQGKLTPTIAKLKVDDYKAVKGYRDLAARLNELQGNNASAAQYAEALKQAVQGLLLTPQQATELMREYQAIISKAPTVAPPITTTTAAGSDFARLQQRLQKGAEGAPGAPITEFEGVEAAQATEVTQDQAQQIQDLLQAMSNQAQQLISSWQPPTMTGKVGAPDKPAGAAAAQSGAAGSIPPAPLGGAAPGASLPVLVKAGTVQFAVLDTEANSDYPDSPIMATIVEGKLKGAKLLGKLRTTKGVVGQMDRISLEFTLMNMDAWPKSRAITAYAIDPDTARTVMASTVNYHYLQRFGAMMATSFLQGYSTAITSSSATTTTGIFGTTTTNPELSPANKLAVGLGQVGQALGKATQNYVNRPPTVRVDSGVGLGILFMTDVS